jgi:protein-S-isoprenylcysteine O-methyltransferase Ste14
MAILVGFGSLALLSRPYFPLAGSWSVTCLMALGWLAFLAGTLIRFWATLYIGGRKRHTLVCEGPYSLCRNPLYVGTFLTWIGTACFLQSLTFAVGVALAIWLFARGTVPAEEERLRVVLGRSYEDYCSRVPRFWPRLSGFRTSNTISVNVVGLRQELRRASRWLWAPIFAQALMQLRLEASWLHFLLLP